MQVRKGQVVITRPSGRYRDAARAYRIEVDGQQVGAIRAGGELVIPLPAGRHVVQARIDWTGSPAISVTIADDQVQLLVVQPAGNALRGLFQIWSRTGYLKLQPELIPSAA